MTRLPSPVAKCESSPCRLSLLVFSTAAHRSYESRTPALRNAQCAEETSVVVDPCPDARGVPLRPRRSPDGVRPAAASAGPCRDLGLSRVICSTRARRGAAAWATHSCWVSSTLCHLLRELDSTNWDLLWSVYSPMSDRPSDQRCPASQTSTSSSSRALRSAGLCAGHRGRQAATKLSAAVRKRSARAWYWHSQGQLPRKRSPCMPGLSVTTMDSARRLRTRRAASATWPSAPHGRPRGEPRL